jgi:hypothetical protein
VLIRGEAGSGKTTSATQLFFFLSCLISREHCHCIPLMVNVQGLVAEINLQAKNKNFVNGDRVQVAKGGSQDGTLATVVNCICRPSDGRIILTMEATGIPIH